MIPKVITINSMEFFDINWSVWKILGVNVLKQYTANTFRFDAYFIWAITANLIATISFPLHLSFGILQAKEKSVLFDGVAISITSIGASLKLFIMAAKMKQILKMENLLRILDARVTHPEEMQHYEKRIRLTILNIQRMYFVIYFGIGMAVLGSMVFGGVQRLFYTGWLPFDWSESLWRYCLAMLYQIFGIFIQICETFSNDSFSPKALCLLSAHIKLLYMRVSRIGFEGSPRKETSKVALQEQENELNCCILDQINLYELYNTIQDIISWAMVVQLLVSILNNCVAIVALLFFVTEPFERLYYVMYIFGLSMQLFPSCYYGSDFVLLFEQLHYAVFSCNWIGQSKSFKRHMMIFTERSLRETMAFAGGIFPIHLDTFFATCKATYSLFALIITMK